MILPLGSVLMTSWRPTPWPSKASAPPTWPPTGTMPVTCPMACLAGVVSAGRSVSSVSFVPPPGGRRAGPAVAAGRRR